MSGATGSPTRELRAAVVGFGKMGLLHAGLAGVLPGSRLVALVDPVDTMTSAFHDQRPDIACYEALEPMLDEQRPDAVFITSPTHLHVPQALACVERGIAFLVEKPLCARALDAAPLVTALARTPVVNAVGYMARHIATFAHARALVAGGALGELHHLRATMYVSQLFKAGKGWRYDPTLSGGGVLITQNSHLIDLLLWLFGPLASVSGHTRSRYSGSVDDFAHAYLTFESGLSGYLDTSWSLRHHRMVDIEIEVHGALGNLTVTDDAVRLYLDRAHGALPAEWSTWRKPDLYRGVTFDIGGPEYTLQDGGFLEAVASGGRVECDVASALAVQHAIDAIYRSAARAGVPETPGRSRAP